MRDELSIVGKQHTPSTHHPARRKDRLSVPRPGMGAGIRGYACQHDVNGESVLRRWTEHAGINRWRRQEVTCII